MVNLLFWSPTDPSTCSSVPFAQGSIGCAQIVSATAHDWVSAGSNQPGEPFHLTPSFTHWSHHMKIYTYKAGTEFVPVTGSGSFDTGATRSVRFVTLPNWVLRLEVVNRDLVLLLGRSHRHWSG